MGAGTEKNAGKGDTPGYNIIASDELVTDERGYTKVAMKRNDRRLYQGSTYLLQLWRANSDLSVIIYDTDPMKPSAQDIAAITQYVINYACKGGTTFLAERQLLKGIIQS